MMVAVVEIADPLDVGKNVARIGVVATIPFSMMDDVMVVEGPKAEMVLSAIADVNTLVGVVKLDENTRREIGVAVGAKVIVKAVGEEFEGARSPVGMTMDEMPFDEAERDAMLEARRPGMSIADFTRRLLEIEQLKQRCDICGAPTDGTTCDKCGERIEKVMTGERKDSDYDDLERAGYPLSEPAHVEENWKREQKARRYVQKRHMDDQAVEERTLGNDMWGVWDNDKREWVVKDETYQVTANVEYALNHGAPGTSEADEVARSILDASQERSRLNSAEPSLSSVGASRLSTSASIKSNSSSKVMSVNAPPTIKDLLTPLDGKAPYLLVTAGAKAYPEAVKHAIALAYERIDKPPRILWSLGRRGIGADGISTPSDNVGASPRLVKLNEEGRPSTGQSRSVPARALSGEPPPGRKLEVQAPFLRGESLTKGATDFITIDMQPRVVATHLREARGEGYEDEGRTYRAYWPKELGHAPKFYVKLDDYGTPEALKESLGKYYPQGSSTQTVITIMLATED